MSFNSPSKFPEKYVPFKGWDKFCYVNLEKDYVQVANDDVEKVIASIEKKISDEIEGRKFKEIRLKETIETDIDFAYKLFTDPQIIGEWLGFLTICKLDKESNHMGIMVGQDHELDWYFVSAQ